MRLREKVALVTGAGSGIGREIACRFAQEGADVAVHDISPEGGGETAEMVRGLHRRAEVYTVDVARAEQVRGVITETIRDFGRVSILVNCAGVNLYRPPFEFTDEEWEWIIGVNLTGTWNYCRYLGPHIVERGGGAIVNVTSIGAFQTSYYRAPYMASKGAITSLTRALAQDLAESNVRVNDVAPGATWTGMTRPAEERLGRITGEMVEALVPMRRWARPQEVANAALFLASDEASFVTGHSLAVDGGLSVSNQFGLDWEPASEPDQQTADE
jgi:NAD(P)-dependent dehydrogenase (short-subunit alcohol dehydrogenase family)